MSGSHREGITSEWRCPGSSGDRNTVFSFLCCSAPVLTPPRLSSHTNISPGSRWRSMISAGTLKSSWWDPMGSLSCAGSTKLRSALSRLTSWRTWSNSEPSRKAGLHIPSCFSLPDLFWKTSIFSPHSLLKWTLPAEVTPELTKSLPYTNWVYVWKQQTFFLVRYMSQRTKEKEKAKSRDPSYRFFFKAGCISSHLNVSTQTERTWIPGQPDLQETLSQRTPKNPSTTT